MDTNKKSSLQSVLLIAGAFAFALCILVSVHELGHAAALRYFGVTQMRIILHPFSASRVVWDSTDEFIGYVDAAGPLAAILFGCTITIALWHWRSPFILPLLFLCPVALITEGFSSTMQLVLRIPGTDMMRIVRAGVPYSLLLVVAISLFLISIVVFSFLLPLANVSGKDSFLKRILILESSFSIWIIIRLIYVLIFSRTDLVPNIFNLVFAILVAAILAGTCKPVCRLLKSISYTEPVPLDWKATNMSLTMAIGIVVILLVFFNG